MSIMNKVSEVLSANPGVSWNDLVRRRLVAALTAPYGSLADLWDRWLTTQGFTTGSLQDKMRRYWDANSVPSSERNYFYLGYRAFFSSPPPTIDPNFSSVVSLLPLDGAQGSTTFTDVKGKTWTATNGAVITTAQSQFGGASLDLTTSSSDCISTTSGLADFAFPGQFTAECWLRRPSVTGSTVLFSAATSGGFSVRLDPSGVLVVYSNGGGDLITSAASTLTTNAWQHIAITRDASNVIRAFVAGTQVGSTTNAISFTQPTVFVIGAEDTAGTVSIDGFVDDVRITKGVARYTSNFTPPTAANPTS